MFTSFLSACIHAHAEQNRAANIAHNYSNDNSNRSSGLRVQSDNALSVAIRGVHAQMQDAGVMPDGQWFRTAVQGALDGGDAG